MKSLVILITLLLPLFSYAQDISGRVIDEDNHPIFAANVYFKSMPNRGVVSDIEGNFIIAYTNNSDTLLVSFIGYAGKPTAARELKVSENTIVLEREALSIDEVVVRGATPVSEQFTTKKISSMDIYMNPISQADPLKAIINLPASTNSDESANPSLRGSSSDRSRVIYNGVPIYNPVRASSLNSVGLFSIFNPEMIDVQTVYPSNPPLIYGNASAGIVDINTIRALNDNKTQVSAGTGNIGLSVSQNIKDKTSFIQAYANWQNSTLLKAINGKNLPDMKMYDTKDAGVNLRFKISDRVCFNSFNYFMNEKFEGLSEILAYQGDILSRGTRYFSVNNFNIYSNIGTFALNYGYNYDKKKAIFGNNNLNTKGYSHFASASYKKELFSNVTLQAGISLDNQNFDVDNTVPLYYYAIGTDSPTYRQDTTLSNTIIEPYLYLNWDISDKVSMSAGVRTNIQTNDQTQYWSGQYSLKYSPSKNHSFIFSAGQYHNFTSPDHYNLSYLLLSSRQASIDYSYQGESTKIESAIYYKIENGVRPVDFYYYINKTKTLGFEVSLQQRIGQYLAVSLSNSIVSQDVFIEDRRYKGGYNYAYFLKPSITYTNPKLLSVGLSYITRPGSYVLNYPISSSTWYNAANAYKPTYTSLEQIQRGAYNILDLTLSKHISFKNYAITMFASVNNLLNTKNETSGIYYNLDYSERYSKYYTFRTFYAGMVFSF